MTQDPGFHTPARLLAFRALLATLAVSTTAGVGSALRDRPGFVASFPGAAHDPVFYLLVGTGILGLVAVLGLWQWRRWAIILFVAVTGASFTLDVVARAPALHQAAVLSMGLLVSTLAYLNRHRFAR